MMEAPGTRGPYVHTRTLPHRLQAFQYLDVGGVVRVLNHAPQGSLRSKRQQEVEKPSHDAGQCGPAAKASFLNTLLSEGFLVSPVQALPSARWGLRRS